MPVLSNPRHERMAQGLFKGKSQIEAYDEAGYSPNPSAASRLANDVKICERVTELQGKAATRSEITVASITENLMRLAQKGEQLNEAPGLSVARAAWMDAAKLNGLVVDKSLTAQTSVEDLLDQLDGKAG